MQIAAQKATFGTQAIFNIAQFMGLGVTCFCQIVDLAQNGGKTLAKFLLVCYYDFNLGNLKGGILYVRIGVRTVFAAGSWIGSWNGLFRTYLHNRPLLYFRSDNQGV